MGSHSALPVESKLKDFRKPIVDEKRRVKKRAGKTIYRYDYAAIAKFVRNYEKLPFRNSVNFDNSQKAKLRRDFQKLKFYRNVEFYPMPKKKIAQLKERGYKTTEKGVFIRNASESGEIELLKNGIVKEYVEDRTDYAINFNAPELKLLVTNPKLALSIILRNQIDLAIYVEGYPKKEQKKLIREYKKVFGKFSNESYAAYMFNHFDKLPDELNIRLQYGVYGGYTSFATLSKFEEYLNDHTNLGAITGIRIVEFE